MQQITDGQAKLEGFPDYVEPVMVFDDQATGRHAAWVRMEGHDWLLSKHPDGEWVTWREVTERDRLILLSAAHHGE